MKFIDFLKIKIYTYLYMDYYSKYLKYKNKYISLRNNINKGGASFPDEDPAFRHAIEESMKSTEEDDIVRQVLKETRDTNFMERAIKAKILVIGASIDHQEDIDRWSQIDPNFIGISHMGDDPISDLGDWNEDENYWITVFNILGNRKFDSIYIDRGTIHHMGTNTGKVIGTAYGRLIKFIHERNITNKLYIHDDSISTTTIKPETIYSSILDTDEEYAKKLEVVYDTESSRVITKGGLSKYLMKYFRCCDTPTYINWSVGGQIIPELFVAWTRRE